MPPRPALDAIRERLAEDQRGFERALGGAAFRRKFGALSEEAVLKRLPRGVASGHPAERWMRYRSFTVSRPLTDEEALDPRIVTAVARDFALIVPLVRWLNGALGYAPADAR